MIRFASTLIAILVIINIGTKGQSLISPVDRLYSFCPIDTNLISADLVTAGIKHIRSDYNFIKLGDNIIDYPISQQFILRNKIKAVIYRFKLDSTFYSEYVKNENLDVTKISIDSIVTLSTRIYEISGYLIRKESIDIQLPETYTYTNLPENKILMVKKNQLEENLYYTYRSSLLTKAGQYKLEYYPNHYPKSIEGMGDTEIYEYDSKGNLCLIKFELSKGGLHCGNYNIQWQGKYNNKNQLIRAQLKTLLGTFEMKYFYDKKNRLKKINKTIDTKTHTEILEYIENSLIITHY